MLWMLVGPATFASNPKQAKLPTSAAQRAGAQHSAFYTACRGQQENIRRSRLFCEVLRVIPDDHAEHPSL
eukprot:scaffold56194_cov21-Tisochrysis_lutea.AAC.1